MRGGSLTLLRAFSCCICECAEVSDRWNLLDDFRLEEQVLGVAAVPLRVARLEFGLQQVARNARHAHRTVAKTGHGVGEFKHGIVTRTAVALKQEQQRGRSADRERPDGERAACTRSPRRSLSLAPSLAVPGSCCACR